MTETYRLPLCRTDDLPPLLRRPGLSAAWMDLDGSALDALDVPLPSALSGAVAKRRGEFRAGRYCAQVAMRCLGVTPPVARTTSELWPRFGADRAPVWPEGVVGGLTHSPRRALCVVARAVGIAGLGVDLELPVPPDEALGLAPAIATAEEIAVAEQAVPEALAFTALFSAKEALYKALYPRVQRIVDFPEVRAVLAAPGELHFELAPDLAALLPGTEPAPVHVGLWHDHVVTLCVLRRAPAF